MEVTFDRSNLAKISVDKHGTNIISVDEEIDNYVVDLVKLRNDRIFRK